MASRFSRTAFAREDESPDAMFYIEPRLVTHIDDYAIAAVGEAYRRFLEPGGDYLDLMSSWVSHFPFGFEIHNLVGHGMNEHELANNPQLTAHFVQDLNRDPQLRFDDATFDGVTICVSVQYLTRPDEVFGEIGRVLKPGAPLIVSFSNRCFPTKAVRIWRALGDSEHAGLVAAYAEDTRLFDDAEPYDFSPRVTLIGIPEDEALRARIRSGEVYTDPLYVVVARRKQA
jgi:SAM-dependent methyltransferase